MDQQNAGAVAVPAKIAQDGCQVSALGGVVIGHSNNLQAVDIDNFVAEDANPSGCDRLQVLTVIAKLFVIAGYKIDSVRCGELLQGFCGAPRVDGRAIV